MANIHVLKTWKEFYQQVADGEKKFEVRKNDRDFRTGDRIVLREWDAEEQMYTGRELRFEAEYILYGGRFGIEHGYCVISLRPAAWFKIPEHE